jgi:predicted transcriptional regulator
MARRATGRPTDLELEILQALWQEGPSTVREVREVLARRRPIAYTTVLTMLQTMMRKSLVQRDETRRAHVYRPRESRQSTLSRLASDLLARAFEGSTTQLVVHALQNKDVALEDLAEISRLLDEMEGREK